MEIPSDISTLRTSRKICRLRKSLHSMKQSPRAWFDRHAVCDMGYKQCYGDHTLFYEHSKYRIAILDITTEEPEQGV
jgi:hypothetical protein